MYLESFRKITIPNQSSLTGDLEHIYNILRIEIMFVTGLSLSRYLSLSRHYLAII